MVITQCATRTTCPRPSAQFRRGRGRPTVARGVASGAAHALTAHLQSRRRCGRPRAARTPGLVTTAAAGDSTPSWSAARPPASPHYVGLAPSVGEMSACCVGRCQSRRQCRLTDPSTAMAGAFAGARRADGGRFGCHLLTRDPRGPVLRAEQATLCAGRHRRCCARVSAGRSPPGPAPPRLRVPTPPWSPPAPALPARARIPSAWMATASSLGRQGRRWPARARHRESASSPLHPRRLPGGRIRLPAGWWSETAFLSRRGRGCRGGACGIRRRSPRPVIADKRRAKNEPRLLCA